MQRNQRDSRSHKLTRTEAVRRQLEQEILAGQHPPGTHLDETVQAARLGCSRTPLREALNQLVAVGLLVRRNHRGVFVATPCENRTLDLLDALGQLEGLCARLAADSMPVADRQKLTAAAGDADRLRRLVRRGCGNTILAELADGLEGRIAYCRRLEGELAAERDRAAASALAQAVAAGDGDTAQQVVRERLSSLCEAVRRKLAPNPAEAA